MTDDLLRHHLDRALEKHETWCHRNGIPLPAGWAGVRAVLGIVDADSRSRPILDGPVLLSHAEAATALRCSRRTVGRLVKAGRLATLGRRVLAASVRRVDRDGDDPAGRLGSWPERSSGRPTLRRTF